MSTFRSAADVIADLEFRRGFTRNSDMGSTWAPGEGRGVAADVVAGAFDEPDPVQAKQARLRAKNPYFDEQMAGAHVPLPACSDINLMHVQVWDNEASREPGQKLGTARYVAKFEATSKPVNQIYWKTESGEHHARLLTRHANLSTVEQFRDNLTRQKRKMPEWEFAAGRQITEVARENGWRVGFVIHVCRHLGLGVVRHPGQFALLDWVEDEASVTLVQYTPDLDVAHLTVRTQHRTHRKDGSARSTNACQWHGSYYSEAYQTHIDTLKARRGVSRS